MSETYSQLKEHKRKKRFNNVQGSRNLLISNGIKFDSYNDNYHLVIHSTSGLIDFWPSTGKFKQRKGNNKISGRGIFNLLKLLGVES